MIWSNGGKPGLTHNSSNGTNAECSDMSACFVPASPFRHGDATNT